MVKESDGRAFNLCRRLLLRNLHLPVCFDVLHTIKSFTHGPMIEHQNYRGDTLLLSASMRIDDLGDHLEANNGPFSLDLIMELDLFETGHTRSFAMNDDGDMDFEDREFLMRQLD
jgi:hypothetical protein